MATTDSRTNMLWDRKTKLVSTKDDFVSGIPKLELHVHIEGTLGPELQWTLAQRNGIQIRSGKDNTIYESESDLKESYNGFLDHESFGTAEGRASFFNSYYGGFQVLRTEADFYDLAMDYLRRAGLQNVRYCEPFFDVQGHTRRGVAIDTVMKGLKRAQIDAEKRFNVKSQWIMCILRDMSLESAMENYAAALPYKDMIAGIGLDSDEHDNPPSKFAELFQQARADGFKLTCHCDIAQADTHRNIREVAEILGGTGAERIDHGLNAAERPELIELIKDKDIGMTLCPWAYCHEPDDEVFPRIRKLFDAGIKITVNSDDPAFMEDSWLVDNLCLVKLEGGFTDKEIVQLQENAVAICWASQHVKDILLKEIREFVSSFPSKQSS